MNNTPRIDMIVDLQYGSTGKGLIAGYLAKQKGYDTIINANMPNAGHTFIDKDGREWVHKVLPNGIVSPNLKRVMLGPGSVFSIKRLNKEIEDSIDLLEGKVIYIHENAAVLTEAHASMERAEFNGISSTMQGSAAAMIHKIGRNAENNPCAGAADRNAFHRLVRVISNQEWNDVLERLVYEGLIEGAQGFSLGINSGFYPFCTSRDTGPARFLSDCAVPHTLLRIVVGTARTYPIRVGNTPGGFSGGGYFDQHELTWESLGLKPETTTVTGRERRIFSFSNQQILEAIQAFRPDCVFLNFCNYIGTADDDPQVETMTNAIIDLGSPVVYLGWGAAEQDIQELGKYEC